MVIDQLLTVGANINLSTYELGIIRQPKVKEIAELPFEIDSLTNYLVQMLQLYNSNSVKDELLEIEPELIDYIAIIEELSKVKISEFRERDLKENYMDSFIDKKVYYSFLEMFLTYFCLIYDSDIKDVQFNNDDDKHLVIYIKDKVLVTHKNFEKLIEIILLFFHIDKKTVEVPPDPNDDGWDRQTHSKREEELIEKFKKKDAIRAEKNRLRLYDYINFLVIGTKRTYDEILNYTYYQMMLVYIGSSIYERYKFETDIFSSCNSTMKIEDITEWRKSVKIQPNKSIY